MVSVSKFDMNVFLNKQMCIWGIISVRTIHLSISLTFSINLVARVTQKHLGLDC